MTSFVESLKRKIGFQSSTSFIDNHLSCESKMFVVKIIKESVKVLIIKFNKELDKKTLNKATEVDKIEFCDTFNQSIQKLPDNILGIVLGNSYRIPFVNLPYNLKYLTIGGMFNNDISNLPPKLKYLYCGESFNQCIDNLPKGLKFLHLGRDFNQSLNNLPNGLEVLELYSKLYAHDINNLPNSLYELHIGKNVERQILKLPRNLIKFKYNVLFSHENLTHLLLTYPNVIFRQINNCNFDVSNSTNCKMTKSVSNSTNCKMIKSSDA